MEKLIKIPLVLSLFLFLYACNNNKHPEIVEEYSVQGFADSLSSLQKKEILDEAYKKALRVDNDSLKKEMLLEISYEYLKLGDSTKFLPTNREARKSSRALGDSVGIAATYWDLGNYYQSFSVNDSAYYHYHNAQKIYEALNDDYYSARLLLNMAIVQKNIKDFTGSEITTTKAISLLKPLKKHKQLYSAYNNLGIIFNELQEYDRSIYYHEKALAHLEKIEVPGLIPLALNNVGVVHENQGNYEAAIQNYERALDDDSLYYTDPELYAMLLDNFAFSKFKAGMLEGLPAMFFDALEIRDSLQVASGITINKLHLAEYFLQEGDTIKAIDYAFQVKKLSEESDNFNDLLSSLLFLSNTVKDSNLVYSQQYIAISDSLQKEERATRNKFARIRFETDEYISETERLNQRVMRISLTALGIFIIFVLLYIIRDQRSRNKLIKQKESANQEIYGLILAQQKTFEEGREKEKQHISRELHDGVLGKLFGVRISLDSLNEKEDRESKKKRAGYISEIQKVAEEIRLVSHKLSKTSWVDVDFQVVLEELIRNQNEGKVHFRLDVAATVDWERVENETKINLYRIVQEGINNIHKHSGASKGTIRIKEDENRLILKIKDNGTGFNYQEPKKGIGLKNMEARVRNLNGKISFRSCTEGTTIEVLLPF